MKVTYFLLTLLLSYPVMHWMRGRRIKSSSHPKFNILKNAVHNLSHLSHQTHLMLWYLMTHYLVILAMRMSKQNLAMDANLESLRENIRKCIR